MKDWRRRLALALAFGVLLVVAYSFLYQWAMWTFEGEQRTYLQSMQVVIESLTTAGFGGDADAWDTPQMNGLVMLMNLSGVLLVFLALPVFIFPMLQEALDRAPPRSTDLTNHVVICGYSRRDEILTNELESAEIPFVYIERDQDVVQRLREQGIPVIHGDSEEVETFENANLEHARAVVADVNDEINPTVILSALAVNPNIPIYSVAHRHEVTPYHRLAGADEVIEAPLVLGESLAARAVTSFAEKFGATVDVETPLEVTELLIEEGSSLIGKPIRETYELREHGATIIGGWFDGKFVISPPPDTVIQPNTILLVAGHFTELGDVKARRLPAHVDDYPRVVVCGHGVVGSVVAETLVEYDIEAEIIDRIDGPGVDIVGDVRDPATIQQADLERARAVVLALDSDTTTIFTTLVIKNLAPDIEIIARVHEADNVWKVYRAGADFAIAMSTISGEMLASLLVNDRDILVPQTSFEFIRTKAPRIEGQTLAEAHVRAETGGTVVAVERDATLITDLGPDFEIESEDVLIAAGTPEDIDRLVDFVHD